MPELTFDSGLHRYFIDGRRVAGVTEVLQAVKLVDYSFLAWDVRDEVLARGRWVHDLCSLRLLRGPIKPTLLARLMNEHPDWMRYFVGFERFLAERPDFKAILVEQKVHHPIYAYAGTFDVLGSLDDIGLCLIDLKTGQAPGATCVQISAYLLALKECIPQFRDQKIARCALELHEDGTYRLLFYRKDSHDRQLWMAALSIYNARKEFGLERDPAIAG